MDDRIYRSTADVQCISYISDSNPSVLLNQRINLSTLSAVHEVVGRPELSSSASSETFHPLVHLTPCNTLLFFLC
jgi:hypothetical protein